MNNSLKFDDSPIASHPQEICAICGRNGVQLFAGLIDNLFGATGSWNLRKCAEPECGLIWLDPMPDADHLWKAYQRYYTHSQTIRVSNGRLYHFWKKIKTSYVCHKFGYDTPAGTGSSKFLGHLLYLFPIRRSRVNAEFRFLPARSRGKLLDVGCGSGDFLRLMSEFGWTCEGVDFDIRAVEAAQSHGCRVYCGSLPDLRLQSELYDTITLNHLIEHVPNPRQYLMECHRLLKPNGRLMIATPNSASLGKRIYKESWRGWEPPRHLHVFSPRSIKELLSSVGFKDLRIRTHNAPYVWEHSHRIALSKAKSSNRDSVKSNFSIVPSCMTVLEQLLLQFRPNCGECIDLLATK